VIIVYIILACLGLTFILKYGTIFNKPRAFVCKCKFLNDLFKCSLCLGFWSGVIVGVFCFYTELLDDKVFLLPLVSSACCWILDNLNNVIQSIEIKLDNDNK
jgi:hypothetical protein